MADAENDPFGTTLFGSAAPTSPEQRLLDSLMRLEQAVSETVAALKTVIESKGVS